MSRRCKTTTTCLLLVLFLPLVLCNDDGEQYCERIEFGLCSSVVKYDVRMPNFFNDNNQLEASQRAAQYEELIRSGCSPHLHLFICELLFPVCPENRAAMKRFDIYPCRSYCRQVKADCEFKIMQLATRESRSIGTGFNCDRLPFEGNGGNGTLHGPCHELPVSQPVMQKQNIRPSNSNQWPTAPSNQQPGQSIDIYKPFLANLDANNVPPFITDTSRIDPNLIRPFADRLPPATTTTTTTTTPPSSSSSKSSSESGGNLLEQAKILGQQMVLLTSRYSNAISVLTVLILLLALNVARLRRVRSGCSTLLSQPQESRRVRSPTGTSHSFSGGTGGQLGGLSPSSSSRSLMLIASQQGKQAPCHKLICNPEHTAEYDYIQVEPRPQQQQQHHQQQSYQQSAQMFSNILLSSPNHQVLLLDAEPPSGQPRRLTTGRSRDSSMAAPLVGSCLGGAPRQLNQQLGPSSLVGYASPYAASSEILFGRSSARRSLDRAAATARSRHAHSPRTSNASSTVNQFAAGPRSANGGGGRPMAGGPSSAGSSSSGSSQSSSAALVSPPARARLQ